MHPQQVDNRYLLARVRGFKLLDPLCTLLRSLDVDDMIILVQVMPLLGFEATGREIWTCVAKSLDLRYGNPT